MRFRWANKELEKVSDAEFLRVLCVERKSDCTNTNAPLYRKIDEIEKRLEVKIAAEKAEAEKPEDTNNHIDILYHDISYYLDDDSEIELGDCESEHIEYSIGQGYREGELNKCDSDGNDGIRGWWSIVSSR